MTDTDSLKKTLRQHLEKFGFDDGYFGESICGARITVVSRESFSGSFESALVPIMKKNRSKSRCIPVSRFLQLGDMLMFPNAMKSQVPPPMKESFALWEFIVRPITTILSVSISLVGKLKGINLGQLSYIEGWVCEHKNPPFSAFPFDQWLSVCSIETTWINFSSPDGRMWRLGTVILTDPERINFSRPV
jgi:hypothetical protein